MYYTLLLFHSYWRYIALLVLLLAIFNAWNKWINKKEYSATDNKLGLFTTIAIHLQFLSGIILYFLSPFVRFSDFGGVMKDSTLRFWTVEHITLMLIAVILITVGKSVVKKAEDEVQKHKKTAIGGI